MKWRFSQNWSGMLLILASVLLLSGCSMVWAMPAPGLLAVLAGLLLGLAASPSAGQAHDEGSDSVPVLSAPGAPDSGVLVPDSDSLGELVTTSDIVGDGMQEAVLAQALADALADVNAQAKPYVFGQDNATSGTDTDLAPIHGDGAEVSGDEIMAYQNAMVSAQGAGIELLSSWTASDDGPIATHALYTDGDGWSGKDDNGFLLVADGDLVNPHEGDREAIQRGGVRFNTRCGTYCHGGRAIGGGCPSLVDESWIHGDSNADIYRVIAGGAGEGTRMGAFGGEFTADEIFEMIAYLRFRQKEFLLEKAGPGSFREQALNCPGEAALTIRSTRNKDYSGVIVIEDTKMVMLEDRSKPRPTRRRVLKSRIDTVELTCVDES